MERIKVSWISTLIILLGAYNMVSGLISIPFEGFLFKILTRSIIIFSGFSTLLTGFVLTLIGYGLYRRIRLAWKIAIILLTISFVANLFTDINIVGAVFSMIFLWILYSKREKFTKSFGITLDVRYLMALWIIIFVLIYGIAGASYLGDQFNPPISTLIQALYYTVITSTTVGYGDFVPVTDQARLFAVSLIFLGVGTFLSAVVLIIQPIMKELEKVVTKWSKR
jgi:voltage-gated potassium channel